MPCLLLSRAVQRWPRNPDISVTRCSIHIALVHSTHLASRSASRYDDVMPKVASALWTSAQQHADKTQAGLCLASYFLRKGWHEGIWGNLCWQIWRRRRVARLWRRLHASCAGERASCRTATARTWTATDSSSLVPTAWYVS